MGEKQLFWKNYSNMIEIYKKEEFLRYINNNNYRRKRITQWQVKANFDYLDLTLDYLDSEM